MPLVSTDELAARAGVDPWKLYGQLQHGDPGEIETLASTFLQAGKQTGESAAAAQRARAYVTGGYTVADTSPVDYSSDVALADNGIKDQTTRQDHLARIGKILDTVGTDLRTATVSAHTEISTLDTVLSGIDNDWTSYCQGQHHGDSPPMVESTFNGLVAQQVAAVKAHGSVISRNVTAYETTLHNALKSMADLGYVPPDAVDEGPGDVDVNALAGANDGNTTIKTAKSGDTAGLTNSTFALSLVNDAIAHNGGRVSDAEYSYLYNYYNTTAKHSDVIDHAVKGHPDLENTVGSTYADGLLNMSNGANQNTDNGTTPYATSPTDGPLGRGGLNGLPPNVLDVLNSRIGQKAPTPDGGSTNSSGGPEILRAVYENGHWVVKNYANDMGFGDLLGYADKNVQGSDQLTHQLATTAINWKHDIDAVNQNTTAWEGQSYNGLPGEDKNFGTPGPDTPTAPTLGDTGPSGLLTAASHNQPASAQILLDAGDRHAILGLPWQGKGAADLIDSGTAPDTGTTPRVPDPNHPNESLLNEAALAVVKDAGSHYSDFAGIASTPVKQALTQLAVTHMASFGDPTGKGAISGVGTIDVPGGQAQGLSLNNTDASNYLKLLSLSGPKYSGVVHAAALELGSRWLQDGGSGHDSGAAHASTLIGRVSSSEYAAAVDKAAHLSGTEQQAYIGEIREEQKQAQQEALQKGVLDGIDTALDIGTMGASEDIKGAVEHFSTFMGAFDTAKEDYGGYQDAGQNTPEQNQLIELGKQVQGALAQPAANAQVHTDVRADLDYAALRASGYHDPTVAYTASAGQESSVVDPALDKYYGTGDAESGYSDQAINTMLPDPSDAPPPSVDWHSAQVQRAINGGDNDVYNSELYKNSMTIDSHLVNVTPK